jgi:hypothetical protein
VTYFMGNILEVFKDSNIESGLLSALVQGVWN